MRRRSLWVLLLAVSFCLSNVAFADGTGCQFDCSGKFTEHEHCIENLSDNGNYFTCRDIETLMLCCEELTGICYGCSWTKCEGQICMIS